MIKLSDIEDAFKSLKYKSPIISVNNNYIIINMDTGWLITNREKFENYLRNEIKTFFRS